jgi:nicotinamidase/pyrazinamidase
MAVQTQRRTTNLISIDPQVDFCDPKGKLYVDGAEHDMDRLANFIRKYGSKLDDIFITQDSHHLIHVAHPIYWKGPKGEKPSPFTIISADDVRKGVWTARNPAWQAKALKYVEALEKNARYPLCIWPPHCLIGSDGHKIMPAVFDALLEWEDKHFGMVNIFTKGSNLHTENYSVIQADVPDDDDDTTKPNANLIDLLQKSDTLYITGEALSHCVANSIRDVASFGKDHVKKFVLLTDTASNVGGPLAHLWKKAGDDFVAEMVALGMRTTTTKDVLA